MEKENVWVMLLHMNFDLFTFTERQPASALSDLADLFLTLWPQLSAIQRLCFVWHGNSHGQQTARWFGLAKLVRYTISQIDLYILGFLIPLLAAFVWSVFQKASDYSQSNRVLM